MSYLIKNMYRCKHEETIDQVLATLKDLQSLFFRNPCNNTTAWDTEIPFCSSFQDQGEICVCLSLWHRPLKCGEKSVPNLQTSVTTMTLFLDDDDIWERSKNDVVTKLWKKLSQTFKKEKVLDRVLRYFILFLCWVMLHRKSYHSLDITTINV